MKAITTTWPTTRIQRCLVRIRRDTVCDLTLRPRNTQGRALLGLSRKLLTITTTDRAAHWLTSSTSLVTRLSPSSPLINGTGTAGLALTDRSAGPRRPRGRYQWPTGAPATVVEDFDPPAVVWGRGHRGVDLAAAEGTQIRSAAAGTVAFAGMVAGRPVVSIDHADGIRTTYEPVEPAVSAGDTVAAGQVIGTLLAGHRSDGVCALHWGARTGPKTYINPLRLLQPAVIRLKPLH